MKHLKLLSCATTASAALLTLSLAAADWPRFRGPAFDGISTEKDWLGQWPGGSPKRLWKAGVGVGFASMVVADGRVYTVGHNGQKEGGTETIYCLDASTGAELWKHSYPQQLDPHYYEGGSSGTPTVAGGRVYTLSKQGDALCLEAASGQVVWSKNIEKEFGLKHPEWGYAGSPHVEDGLVIYNAGSAGVALQAATGAKAWVSGKDAAGYSSPVPVVAGGRRGLALFNQRELVSIDPKSGAELWRFPWKTKYDVNAADPVPAGVDRVFVSSGYGNGCAVWDLKDGKPRQLWFNKEIRNHFSSSIVMGDHVYGVDGQGDDNDSQLKCLELSTGRLVWASPKATTGSVIAADGRLIWLTGAGELVVVEASPKGYHEIIRAQVGGGKYWAAPVLSNGRVYLRNWKGELLCVDVKGGGKVG